MKAIGISLIEKGFGMPTLFTSCSMVSMDIGASSADSLGGVEMLL